MTNLPAACRRTREGLTEYLEDALSPRRRQGLDVHLAECETCRRRLDELRRLAAATAALRGEPMPEKMKAELLRRFREG